MMRHRWRDWLSFRGIDDDIQGFFNSFRLIYNKDFEEAKKTIHKKIQQLQLNAFFKSDNPKKYLLTHDLFFNTFAAHSPETTVFLRVMAYFFKNLPRDVLPKTFEYASLRAMHEDAEEDDKEAFFLICRLMEKLGLKKNYSKTEKNILAEVYLNYIKKTDNIALLASFFDSINESTFLSYQRNGCWSQIFFQHYPTHKINFIECLQKKIIRCAKDRKGEISRTLLGTVFSKEHERHGVTDAYRIAAEKFIQEAELKAEQAKKLEEAAKRKAQQTSKISITSGNKVWESKPPTLLKMVLISEQSKKNAAAEGGLPCHPENRESASVNYKV